jgi:hypothetical protein
MATITSAASGNFSDTATWVGGVVPTVGDIAVAATGHVIAIDVDTTVAEVRQAGTGKFTLGNGRTLTANVQINAGTFTSGGTVDVTATTGNTATIIGSVSGVASTTASVAGVVVSGLGRLVLDGSITTTGSNSSTPSAGVYTNVNSEIVVTGNVDASVNAGARKMGIYCGPNSNPVVTITGNLNGGNQTTSHAVNMVGTGATCTVVGNVSGGLSGGSHGVAITAPDAQCFVVGDVMGGSGLLGELGVSMTATAASCTVTGDVNGGTGTNAFAVYLLGASSFVDVTGTITASSSNHGVRSDATSVGVRLAGDLIDQQNGTVACWTRVFRIASTAPSGVTQYANDASFPTGGLVSRVSPDNVTGMPAQADVRDGLTFGYNGDLEGTLAVPPAASVAAGVPVDATVGTAAVRLQDIADVTGAQIAAAITS